MTPTWVGWRVRCSYCKWVSPTVDLKVQATGMRAEHRRTKSCDWFLETGSNVAILRRHRDGRDYLRMLQFDGSWVWEPVAA